MGTMLRKQVYIAPEQEVALKNLSAETGLSEAELIRQALDRQAIALRTPRRDLRFWYEERRFITEWVAQGTFEGKRTWTREELHER
jgi:hypothetical protein